MSITVEQHRALERRVADLEESMRVIGRILVDESNTPQRRMDRVLGVLDLYDCAPQKAASTQA